jgi:hypothetical protein
LSCPAYRTALTARVPAGNVWRKHAFADLQTRFRDVRLPAVRAVCCLADGCEQVKPNATPEWLHKCIDVFRERIDYAVENTIPGHKYARAGMSDHPDLRLRTPE